MFRILVVEDDADLNSAVCTYLRKNGFDAEGCYNTTQAYSAMYDNVHDLIISDIMMPGEDGFEFAKKCSVSFGYDFGLVDVQDSESAKTRNASISVGYKF